MKTKNPARTHRRPAKHMEPVTIYEQFQESISGDMRAWADRPVIDVGIRNAFIAASVTVPSNDSQMFGVLLKASDYAPPEWIDFYRKSIKDIKDIINISNRGLKAPVELGFLNKKFLFDASEEIGFYFSAFLGIGVVDWALDNGILATLYTRVYVENMKRKYPHHANLYTNSHSIYDLHDVVEEGDFIIQDGRYSGHYRSVIVFETDGNGKNGLNRRVSAQIKNYNRETSNTFTHDPRTLPAEYGKGDR